MTQADSLTDSWVYLEQNENSILNTSDGNRLKLQVKKSLRGELKAGANNTGANSGKQALKDLPRMAFIINNRDVHKGPVKGWCEEKNSRSDREKAKDVFIKIFRYVKEQFQCAQAKIPVDSIIEELITNCNQAGYQAFSYIQMQSILDEFNLLLKNPDERTISIDCVDSNYVSINYESSMPVFDKYSLKEICKLDSRLKFKLKDQGNGLVVYEDVTMSFEVPEELEKHTNDKDILSKIKKHFSDDEVNNVEASSDVHSDTFSAQVPDCEQVKCFVEEQDAIVDSSILEVGNNMYSDLLEKESSKDSGVSSPGSVISGGKIENQESIDSEVVTFDVHKNTEDDKVSISSDEMFIAGDVSDGENSTLQYVSGGSDCKNGFVNSKRSKLSIAAVAASVIASVASGVFISVYLQMVAVGIAVGACTLAITAVVYYCTEASSALENSDTEVISNNQSEKAWS